jgi:inorganic pyrophosphatase
VPDQRDDLSVIAMIEIPKGSRNKYEYDKERKALRFDRMLFSAVHYPSDYGFILDTLAEDQDPLDALVLVWEPTFPGCLIEVKPIGLFKMWDEKGPDEKILCVPVSDPNWNHLTRLGDVPPHLLKEIEHFFTIYKELEKKKTAVEGWEDRDSAVAKIDDAQRRFRDQGRASG